jgi:hypothetical protein
VVWSVPLEKKKSEVGQPVLDMVTRKTLGRYIMLFIVRLVAFLSPSFVLIL